MEKKNIDWSKLGFEYTKTDYRFSAIWENGQWSPGELVTSEVIQMHEGSPALHYAQQCFEGLKAQTAKDGRILLFRPELNCERMQNTADRLSMPRVPPELFLHGVHEAVRANAAWVPPYGSGATLYIRPLLIGVGANMGLRPAKQYEFRVMVCPVGPYYKSGGPSTTFRPVRTVASTAWSSPAVWAISIRRSRRTASPHRRTATSPTRSTSRCN